MGRGADEILFGDGAVSVRGQTSSSPTASDLRVSLNVEQAERAERSLKRSASGTETVANIAGSLLGRCQAGEGLHLTAGEANVLCHALASTAMLSSTRQFALPARDLFTELFPDRDIRFWVYEFVCPGCGGSAKWNEAETTLKAHVCGECVLEP